MHDLYEIEIELHQDLIHYQQRTLLWEKEKITLIVNIQRDGKEVGQIKFIVSPSEYNDIMNLKGAHRGYLIEYDKEIVINFLSTDVFIVVSDNYKEIRKVFDERMDKDDEEYRRKKKERKKKKEEAEKNKNK